jgi:hypothetical protein
MTVQLSLLLRAGNLKRTQLPIRVNGSLQFRLRSLLDVHKIGLEYRILGSDIILTYSIINYFLINLECRVQNNLVETAVLWKRP